MESKGKISNKKYTLEPAVIRYENGQLIFATKPYFVSHAFGLIGSALVSEKERFRMNISEVTNVKTYASVTGKPVFEITTINDFCKVTFNKEDAMTAALREELKDKLVIGR